MSFLSTLGNIAKTAVNFLKSDSTGARLAKTAILGYTLNKLQNSINASSTPRSAPDPGTRVSVNPDTEASIPVIYGQAYAGGKITDAVLSGDNKTLWLCYTICEQTGNTIEGDPSTISIDEVYWDGLKLEFQSDGITVDKVYDEDGNSADWSNLIKIYPFSGNSETAIKITGQANGNSTHAYNLFPNWDSLKMMNDLVFVLVRVTYDSSRKISSVGNIQFKVTNTMTDPGDCLYDYMTNTRYGAGIPPEEVLAS